MRPAFQPAWAEGYGLGVVALARLGTTGCCSRSILKLRLALVQDGGTLQAKHVLGALPEALLNTVTA